MPQPRLTKTAGMTRFSFLINSYAFSLKLCNQDIRFGCISVTYEVTIFAPLHQYNEINILNFIKKSNAKHRYHLFSVRVKRVSIALPYILKNILKKING